MVQDAGCGKVDLKPIYSGEVREIEFSFELPDEQYGFSDISFDVPVKVCGIVTRKASGKDRNEGYTELSLTVTASVTTECARCLEQVKEKLTYTKAYGLTETRVSEDSEDYITTENGVLDALDVARTLLLLNIPMRFLCREDCAGLCSGCGANLNNEKCKCTEKEIDPRLAVLKNLKFDD